MTRLSAVVWVMCVGLLTAGLAGCATHDGALEREMGTVDGYIKGAVEVGKQVGGEIVDGTNELIDKVNGD